MKIVIAVMFIFWWDCYCCYRLTLILSQNEMKAIYCMENIWLQTYLEL